MVSRVAKNPVKVPQGVEVTFADKTLKVKGKNGELMQVIHPLVSLVHENEEIKFAPGDSSQEANALAGTMRALAQNMVTGVTEGFVKKLVMKGVGYRAKVVGNNVLDLSVGFSHPVNMEMPAGVSVATPTQTEIVLTSADKQLVAQVAANIRHIRPPEPYKGKGIRYEGEQITLKEGKKK
ncbi:MAG: 50S ribosomal protein L6 [Coxiella sp. (in: Bacteria)]|nr:MAG: 50S ribosomal protein L6 [Coxiella sp. (in: g-proteobacteria)]